MINVLIVEDEILIQELLVSIIKDNHENAHVLGVAHSVKVALEMIEENQPDLVFLDVRLKDGTGFDFLDQVSDRMFEVVFVTAYDEFAIRAVKNRAIDYILKPFEAEEIVNVLRRFEEITSTRKPPAVVHQTNHDQKIVLKTLDKTYIIKIQDIIRCESHRGYTMFYLVNGSKVMVSKTLSHFVRKLERFSFFQVHKTHLINLSHLSVFEKGKQAQVRLSDNAVVPVAGRRREELARIISNYDL
ncbi:MAG: response regulator transcription factor [Bacteroidia bacterium]|nr:response regulator transcription factor [Bacteroidia bacterium]